MIASRSRDGKAWIGIRKRLFVTWLDILIKTSYINKQIIHNSQESLRLEHDFKRTGKMAEN